MSVQEESGYAVKGLAYLVVQTPKIERWAAFAGDVLGLEVRQEDDGLRLRLDQWRQRIFVEEGPADDVVAIGWEMSSEAAFDALDFPEEDGGERGVARLKRTVDPAGTPTELVFGPSLADEPFVSSLVPSGFVTDEQGMGHCVVTSTDKAASHRFYSDLLGFRLSDHIVTEFFGHAVDLDFLHTGPRHHSVAFGGPQRKRIHHFMLEVADLDDVGMCLDRCLKAGVPIAQTIGKHPNDRMVSFYALTPSKFQFEFGWGGRVIGQDEDAAWQTSTYDHISEWGHHPPMVYAPRKPREAQ